MSKSYFQGQSPKKRGVKVGFELPSGPSQINGQTTGESGRDVFTVSRGFVTYLLPRLINTQARPTGDSMSSDVHDSRVSDPPVDDDMSTFTTYYTGAAADFNRASRKELAEMNLLQQDLLVLNKKVSEEYLKAMETLITNGSYKMPTTGQTLRRIPGENEYDTRLRNSFQVWRASFDDAQANLNSFYQIGEETDGGVISWKGNTVSFDFIDTILDRFMSGYDKEIITNLSKKFSDQQARNLKKAKSYNEGDYDNVLITTVIFVDAIKKVVGATLSITVFQMEHSECVNIECGKEKESGKAAYTFQGVQYAVNASLLRKQIGSNAAVIEEGNEWFNELEKAGHGAIVYDDNALPRFFE